MAKYYQDFVGLNTFMYEVNGYDAENQKYSGQSNYEAYNSNGIESILPLEDSKEIYNF